MSRSTPVTAQKPEYVLKRANELIKTGSGSAVREKRLALDLLLGFISARRRGPWSKVYEDIMSRVVGLCVDLREHRTLKDGLHQFRNLCQNTEPVALEHVINTLLELTEVELSAARSNTDETSVGPVDLEQEDSPESILLSSMGDDGKQRTDREALVPWLKFQWEAYRAILELLFKNNKYEKFYHKCCEKASKFCNDFKRTLEFRRLSEMLAAQLQTLQKMSVTMSKTNKLQFEWSQESTDLHVVTRLLQLDIAANLELWNVGFHIVEGIHSIFTAAKRAPKTRYMIQYYEKLYKIFWKSENFLFHAYSCYKHYVIRSESRREYPAETKDVMASIVLLSALIIPSLKEQDPNLAAASNMAIALDEEESNLLEKNQQMATLLDFQSNPTRQNLLADILAKGIQNDVLPELRQLYQVLEGDFKPLTLPKRLQPIITAIKAHPALAEYAVPLQRVAVLKIVQQLSKVYSTLKIDKLRTLLAYETCFPDLTFTQIEKVLIDGVARKQLFVKIDHVNKCLRFGSAAAAEAAAEVQVAQLGAELNKVFFQLTAALRKHTSDTVDQESRRAFLELCAQSAEENFKRSMERKGDIDELKRVIDLKQRLNQQKEEKIHIETERQREKQMRETLARMEQERELERQRQEAWRTECEKTALEVLRYTLGMPDPSKFVVPENVRYTSIEENRFGQVDLAKLMKLGPEQSQQLVTSVKIEYSRQREELQKRLNDQAHRLDIMVRAARYESSSVAQKRSEAADTMARANYEKQLAAKIEEARLQHAVDLERKRSLARMQPLRAAFESRYIGNQVTAHEARVAAAREEALLEHWQAKLDEARRRRADDLRRIAAEAKAEEDRALREAYEKTRAEKAALEAEQQEKARLENEKKPGYVPRSLPPPPSAGDEDINWRRGPSGPPPPTTVHSAAPTATGPSVPPGSAGDGEINWRRGPSGSQQPPANAGSNESAPSPSKFSRAFSSDRNDAAVSGPSTGGGGSWRGSSGGSSAPTPAPQAAPAPAAAGDAPASGISWRGAGSSRGASNDASKTEPAPSGGGNWRGAGGGGNSSRPPASGPNEEDKDKDGGNGGGWRRGAGGGGGGSSGGPSTGGSSGAAGGGSGSWRKGK